MQGFRSAGSAQCSLSSLYLAWGDERHAAIMSRRRAPLGCTGTIGGELRLRPGAKNEPRNLAFGGSKRILTMMQPCASGGESSEAVGPFYQTGVNSHGTGRHTTTSDRHRRFAIGDSRGRYTSRSLTIRHRLRLPRLLIAAQPPLAAFPVRELGRVLTKHNPVVAFVADLWCVSHASASATTHGRNRRPW
jgi:hypothetical protein